MQSNPTQKALICPLDWGLGHATRCIPIIHNLLKQGTEVIVAASPAIKPLLKSEFPQLQFIDVFGYDVKYSNRLPLWLKLLLQVPQLFSIIKKENKWLDDIIEEYKIDLVISDNRYGLYSSKTKCVFITHQLFIQSPIFSKIINLINHRYIKHFSECWVPDNESENNLSGALSHGKHNLKNVKYIGILSRFHASEKVIEKKYDFCVLLSGLEPQRSILENKLVAQLLNSNKQIVLIRGTIIESVKLQLPGNIEVHNFLNGSSLQEKIEQSEYIVCRGGYSSIMDLAALRKKAIFIPTPGQTEQEYLAQHLKEKFNCVVIQQKQVAQKNIFNKENYLACISISSA